METSVSQARLILASGSPRRRELLAFLGIPFAVVPSDAEERASGRGLEQVAALARLKGADVFVKYPSLPVLSADTLVCVDDLILGKPVDEADARGMLSLLSGRWHSVYTGICLHIPGGTLLERVETTRVKFRRMAPEEIDRYVRTGEPMDKAGAYGMQQIGGIFVERVEGSPTNVIGLPLATVASLFAAAGISFGEEAPR
ncbi:MAG: Maf family protein [Eubacteriales bacterium]|nr:Maf family protein [Eubacteriales bacterium]